MSLPQCPITGNASTLQKQYFGNSQYAGESVTEVSSNVTPGLTILDGQVKAPFASILAYLAKSEDKETDVWYRDDYRIAWLTVLHCSEGIDHPWEYAFWRYLGKHPSKAIPEMVARHNMYRDPALPKPPETVKLTAKSAKAGA